MRVYSDKNNSRDIMLHVRVDAELLRRMDVARADLDITMSRSEWIRQALGDYLDILDIKVQFDELETYDMDRPHHHKEE